MSLHLPIQKSEPSFARSCLSGALAKNELSFICQHNVIGDFLLSEVNTSFDCRKWLRIISHIENDIPLKYQFNNIIINGFSITIHSNLFEVSRYDESLPRINHSDSVSFCDLRNILSEWMNKCISYENRILDAYNDPFVGYVGYFEYIGPSGDFLMLTNGQHVAYLHKTDILAFPCDQQLGTRINVGDRLYMKIVKVKPNNRYIGSMMAAYPELNPLLEPNLIVGANWKGVVAAVKNKGTIVRCSIDISTNFSGLLWSCELNRFTKGMSIDVCISELESYCSFSEHANYCKGLFLLADNRETVYEPSDLSPFLFVQPILHAQKN